MGKKTNLELSILVVDDDENIRLILQKTLEKEGYHVSTCKSAEEALKTLQRSFFHVVITDIMMAEMTGVEFLSSSIKFKYNRNFFKESFKTTEQIDSARALSDLGEAIIETVELPYVSHTSSASGVVHDKSFFMAEGRVVVTLGCEASFFKSLSVGNEIKLSHFRGLGSSGFSDKIFRVIGKSLAADDEALVCSLTLVDLSSDLGLSHQFRKFGNESIMVGEYGFMTGSFQSDMTSMLDTEALYPLFKETPVIT